MTKKQFKKSVSRTLATGIILEKELSTDEVFNELIKLEQENKELKYKLRNCKDARQSYKQDWKACSSYCDEYKSKIISLKDEVEGLIEENNELKKENDILIKQRLGEERLKQEIADYHTSNSKLHRLNNELIRRLDKFNINYLDILEDLND